VPFPLSGKHVLEKYDLYQKMGLLFVKIVKEVTKIVHRLIF